jgi:hypothetical protein
MEKQEKSNEATSRVRWLDRRTTKTIAGFSFKVYASDNRFLEKTGTLVIVIPDTEPGSGRLPESRRSLEC